MSRPARLASPTPSLTEHRVITAVCLGYTTLTSAFTSSIFSTATAVVAEEYGVSTEVGLLGLSLYVVGFAFGPVIWGPLSELQGSSCHSGPPTCPVGGRLVPDSNRSLTG